MTWLDERALWRQNKLAEYTIVSSCNGSVKLGFTPVLLFCELLEQFTEQS